MKKLFILLVTILMNSCATNSEWTALFDGQTVKGLRGYRDKGMPDSWEVLDGTLKTKSYGSSVELFHQRTFDFNLVCYNSAPLNLLGIECVGCGN